VSGSTMDHYGRWENDREQFHDARDVAARLVKEIPQVEAAVLELTKQLNEKTARLEKLSAELRQARGEMGRVAA